MEYSQPRYSSRQDICKSSVSKVLAEYGLDTSASVDQAIRLTTDAVSRQYMWAQLKHPSASYLILKVNLCPSIHKSLDRCGMPVLRGDVKGSPTILQHT